MFSVMFHNPHGPRKTCPAGQLSCQLLLSGETAQTGVAERGQGEQAVWVLLQQQSAWLWPRNTFWCPCRSASVQSDCLHAGTRTLQALRWAPACGAQHNLDTAVQLHEPDLLTSMAAQSALHICSGQDLNCRMLSPVKMAVGWPLSPHNRHS